MCGGRGTGGGAPRRGCQKLREGGGRCPAARLIWGGFFFKERRSSWQGAAEVTFGAVCGSAERNGSVGLKPGPG